MDSCIGKTYDEIKKAFFAKHGENPYTQTVHRVWTSLGKQYGKR